MPVYEYECEKCGKVFEISQSMKDDPLTDCPDEGCKGKVKRLISSTGGVIFKGSGFYSTDYKKKPEPSSCAAASEGGGCATGKCPLAKD